MRRRSRHVETPSRRSTACHHRGAGVAVAVLERDGDVGVHRGVDERRAGPLPRDVYEAAKIDRANAIQRFFYITLPLIRSAVVIVIILRSMIALSAFAAIFAATRGGPGTATEILNLYAYKTSFVELNFGYGSALAVALLVITLGVSGVLFHMRTARRG